MNDMPTRYLSNLIERLQKVQDSQSDAINAAADICAKAILDDKLVFTFGTGHGSFAAMEMFPRTGTVTGFRPIVESRKQTTLNNPQEGRTCDHTTING